MAAAKTVWIQNSVPGRVPATAGQTAQNCCYLCALWHEDQNTSNTDMTCKDSFLRQNNLHTAWGRLLLCSTASCAKLPKYDQIQRAVQPDDEKPLSLLKITQFLISGLNIFTAKQDIFACDCLKDDK